MVKSDPTVGIVLEKERVLAAAKSCPQAEAVLKILCPEFFEQPKPEWEPRVGDVVKCIKEYVGVYPGDLGVVVGINEDVVGVFWNRKIEGGHDCNGRCPGGHGRYIHKDNISFVGRGQ